MSSGTVSIGVHQDFTPEVRDRILRNLQARMEEPSYGLLTPSHLRELSRIESEAAPILSLYLQLTPERRQGKAWRSAVASLAHGALAGLADGEERQRIENEIERVEEALESELPRLGRGVAFFVCEPIGLWRQIAVPVPLADSLRVGSRPYVRPLVRTRDEHERSVLALLSRERSRFLVSQIGQVEEVYRVKGQRVRGMFTDYVAPDRRDVIAVELMKKEARAMARIAELVCRQFEARHLLVSAPSELYAAFLESLPKVLREQVDTFEVDVHATAAEIARAAEPAQRAVEAREEEVTVRALIESGPAGAAWGVQETLDCLREGRVRKLVVDDAHRETGERCDDCGALFLGEVGTCAVCGSRALTKVDDLAETALEQALVQNAGIEIVRSEQARPLLAERGSVGALLRY